MLIEAKKIRFLVAALAAVTLSPGIAAAQDGVETVTATGEAAIVNGNKLAAKDAAKRQALRAAVEQVAGTIVTGVSETKEWINVRDEVTSQGSGYVKKFEITKSQCGADLCSVTIKAQVAKGALKDRLSDIGLLLQQKRYPRVLLMVAEQNADAPQPGFWWGGGQATARSQYAENDMVRFLNRIYQPGEECDKRGHLDKDEDNCWKPLPAGTGFRFVDYMSVAGHPLVQQLKGEKLDDESALTVAKLTDAEIAIVGTAHAKNAGVVGGTSKRANPNPMYSVGSSLSVRVIEISTGRIIATVSKRAVRLHIDPAVGGAMGLQWTARMAVPELQKTIAEVWQADETGSRWVKLEVDGLKSYGDLTKFKSLLQSGVTGVQSVQQRKMEGATALLELQTTATSEDLATELSAKPLGDFTVQITRVSPGVLGVKLAK